MGIIRNLLLLAVLVLAGCKDAGIKLYRVAKEDSQSSTAPAANSSMEQESAPNPFAPGPSFSHGSLELHWNAPGEWTELPPSGMRASSFEVPGETGPADLSIVALAGEAGGELANINRWREQIGLGPLNESELSQHSQNVPSRAGNFLVVDFSANKQPQGPKTRLLAAILLTKDKSWFFKMTGPEKTVEAAKNLFLKFLASVHAANH